MTVEKNSIFRLIKFYNKIFEISNFFIFLNGNISKIVIHSIENLLYPYKINFYIHQLHLTFENYIISVLYTFIKILR